MALFSRYRWPGNVRQLANVLRTGVALLDDGEDAVTTGQVGDEFREAHGAACLEPPSAEPLSGDLRQLAEARIRETLATVGGNMSEAARRLGVSRNTLYRRLRGYRLRRPDSGP
jgi:transcriptional regulator of acetoin/glycerol metabolism